MIGYYFHNENCCPFDVFITADKNLRYQQNLAGKILRIVILNSRSTRPNSLLPLMEQISEVITSLSVGILISINDSGHVE